ncbi:hypothetical protein GCM10022409_14930 [Hymenobacter glaciei]|uniref:Secretion system C-terminal sorting domain-containing protein n=1 Tax=Hymenobacter glaciei TaxID=877209 RepID=A0ABP7TV09_9BACT
MKTTLRMWAGAAGLLVSLLPHLWAHAEGSKQLTPNRAGTPTSLTDPANTVAGYLMHDSGPASTETFLKPNAPDDHRLFVRMKPGETLYYGLQRTDTGDGRSGNQGDVIITIRYRDGAGNEQVAQTTTLARSQAAANTSQAQLLPQSGVIDDAVQNQAGPKTTANPTGYEALTLTYPATGTGPRDYWVELTQVGESGLAADLKRSYYNFWDFTVLSPAGQEQAGRLFSQFWGFSSGASPGAAGAYQNRLSADFSLFTLIPNPQDPTKFFVKEVELAGLRPYDFVFVANSRGTSTPGTFAESRKSVTGASAPTEYSNFVNDPDPSLWPSATAPVFVRTAKAFCNPLTGLGGVAFTTTSGEQGSVTVLIDLNGNRVQDGNDVLLTQNVAANVPATIVWDGKDRLGNVVAPGTSIDLAFTSFGAPVNYPLYDAEGNPDGLRIQNVRPSSGGGRYFDRLYWDDTNLSAAEFPDRTRLNGEISTAGVHRWGDASNQAGNVLTINTWSYGFITPIDQVYVYEYTCDNDNDGVTDATDLDDDNDGILDTQETGGVNPQLASGGTLLYLDAAYVHPIFGRFRDRNNDGINDWFDTDLDGVPNHFDLDADNDGLPDAVEAGLATLAWSNGANSSQYSPTESRFAGTGDGVGLNGLPNAVENRLQPDTEVNSVRYTLPDNDGDTFVGTNSSALNYDYLDLDSDNDGLTDELEAQSTAAYAARLGSAGFATDTDQDGLRDAYDANNGGSAAGPAVDTNANAVADMFDVDTDGDNATKSALPINLQTADWTEGFDTNGDGRAGDEILAKALAFAVANPAQAAYYAVTDGVRSPFLQDANGNGVPNFLEQGSASYHDDNFNGLVDLYDPTYGGSPGTAPRASAGAAEAAFRTATAQVPLPVTLVSFEARAAGAAVVLNWRTAQELRNHHFVVERSVDGRSFAPLATVAGQGTTMQPTAYAHTDAAAAAAALGVSTLYYRLQAVDDEGKPTLSPVRTVRFPQVAAGPLALYPNPTADRATLDLRSLPVGRYSVQVFDATGRRLQQATYPAEQPVLDLRSLPAGAYFVQVRGEGINTVLPLLKH